MPNELMEEVEKLKLPVPNPYGKTVKIERVNMLIERAYKAGLATATAEAYPTGKLPNELPEEIRKYVADKIIPENEEANNRLVDLIENYYAQAQQEAYERGLHDGKSRYIERLVKMGSIDVGHEYVRKDKNDK